MASRKKRRRDPDNPEWTAEDFVRAKKAEEALPPDVLAQFGRHRGPNKVPTKVPVSIRLSPVVVNHFKGLGPGWQSRINRALEDIVIGRRRRKQAVRKKRSA